MLDVHVTAILVMARSGHYNWFFNIVLPDTATGNSVLESLSLEGLNTQE